MTTPPRELLPYPGSSVIYGGATGLERAMADAGAERLLAIDAEEIISVWDPYMISASNLPYLAYAMGVLLWEPGWQEATKREWVARQWEWKAIRGTQAGIEMAVNFVGRDHAQTDRQYDLVELLAPPQGFFASSDLTKEEWDEWVHLMPELRIKLAEGRGVADPDEWFADSGPGYEGEPFSDVLAWCVYQITTQGVVTYESEFDSEAEAQAHADGLGGPPYNVVARGLARMIEPPAPTIPAPGTSFGIAAPDPPPSPPPQLARVWAVYTLVDDNPPSWRIEAEFATQAEAEALAASLDLLGGTHLAAPGPLEDQSPLPPPTDGSFVGIDDGWILHGRRVILRQWGVDTPLQDVVRDTYVEEGKTIDIERVRIPGKSTLGFFADEDAAGEDKFVDVEEITPRLISLRLDGSYIHERSVYGLSLVWPTLEPLDPRYERESDIGDAGPFFFADDGVPGFPEPSTPAPPGPHETTENAFAGSDDAADMLADRIFLLDPDIVAPMTAGMSFAGVDRVGMANYHAEALIDLHTKEEAPSWFSDDSFEGEGFAVSEDGSHIDRACRAVVAAKALRDKIGVTFNVVRPLEPEDIVEEDTLAGEYRRNLL